MNASINRLAIRGTELLTTSERTELEQWLFDNAEELVAGARELAEMKSALSWIGEHGTPPDCRAVAAARSGDVVEYARSLGWPGQ